MMCGIFCEICYSNKPVYEHDIQLLNRIQKRGPNHIQTLHIFRDEGLSVFFCASVLWMQGPQVFPQPAKLNQGVLLYNGDIFDETWDNNFSDTQLIVEKLGSYLTSQHSENLIIQQLKLLKGPFALIYYDEVNNNLYFTRDKIGRSSLLFCKNNVSVIISNVLGRNYDCVEIPATHIQILNLSTKSIKSYPWDDKLPPEELPLEVWIEQLQKKQSIPDDEFKFDYEEVDLRDEDGVIDHIKYTVKPLNCNLSLLENILKHSIVKQTVITLSKLLYRSVELRLKRQPNKCLTCLNIDTICNHCTVGILFSGGLDCTILALLADKCLPKDQSIDLINVAFKKDNNASYDVPDRLTGIQSLQELQNLCPPRKWNFMEVNISKEELEKYQVGTIGDLIYPRQTILDESLGTALWFASRGINSTSTSTSRILLVGSGADELFGGYIRHRNAFKRNGWIGLHKELQLDWNRISFRNLARDNRVICDHGRQPRFPYLDEDFTNYVLQLKPWLRCFPSEDLPIGLGDKLMLRLVAFSLGLTKAVVLPKRALQFGSRIANKKEKGSDISKTFYKNKDSCI